MKRSDRQLRAQMRDILKTGVFADQAQNIPSSNEPETDRIIQMLIDHYQEGDTAEQTAARLTKDQRVTIDQHISARSNALRMAREQVEQRDPTIPREHLRPENEDETIVCEICKETVNRYSVGDEETWIHVRPWLNQDHQPQPKIIPVKDHRISVCDYCNEYKEIHWSYVGEVIRQRTPDGVQDFGTSWLACEECSAIINTKDLNKLANRVMRVKALTQGLDMSEIRIMREAFLDLWTRFFETVYKRQYVGPRIEPAKLNPRMMPKLQQGLVKFWNRPELHRLVNASLAERGVSHSIPGIHAGDENDFIRRYTPGEQIPDNAWNNFTSHITAGLWASDLYWISSNFTRLAILAGQDFDTLNLSREELPSKFGFMVYEDAIGTIQRPGCEAHIRAISWTLVPDGIWLSLYVQGEDGDPGVDIENMRREMGYLMCPNNGSGFKFDNDIELSHLHTDVRFVATIFATWFLMNQPGVTDTESAPVDKKLARSYQREHGRKLPDVRLVDLRKRPRRTGDGTQEREGRPLEYRQYRKGHWKRQPYGPARSLRKTIYVSPYIAGPEGAPLKDKPITVKVLR